MPRPREQPGRPGRFRRWLDRTVLGLLMGVAIWFVERRLRKVLGAASTDDDPARRVVDVG